MIERKRLCDICGNEMPTDREEDRWEIILEKYCRNGNRKTNHWDMCADCRISFSKWVESRILQADCSWMKAEE